MLLLRWWYGPGWVYAFQAISTRTSRVLNEFSVTLLLRTLFEPWKQITLYSGQNASLDTKFHVLVDNIFSRLFGLVIRLGTIIAAFFVTAFVGVFGVVIAVSWPLIPLLPIVFLFLAVVS